MEVFNVTNPASATKFQPKGPQLHFVQYARSKSDQNDSLRLITDYNQARLVLGGKLQQRGENILKFGVILQDLPVVGEGENFR